MFFLYPVDHFINVSIFHSETGMIKAVWICRHLKLAEEKQNVYGTRTKIKSTLIMLS